MIDKERLTVHIKDVHIKKIVSSALDKACAVTRSHDARSTDFLNPYELRNVASALNSLKDEVSFKEYSGCEGAERKCIAIYPWYMDAEELTSPVEAICISGNFKFRQVSHRDYLGSIMGLGIRREKIGDIHVHENSCHVVVKSEIADFLSFNFSKVSSNRIETKIIPLEELVCTKPEFKAKGITVSSMRLDCIISGIYNVSRSEAVRIITSGLVRVDYEPVIEPSRQIVQGSLLSVRGKGRSFVDSINGNTKRGRISVAAKIMI